MTPLPPRQSRPVWVINLALSLLIVSLYPINLLVGKYMDPYIVTVLISIGLNIILATSLNLINGVTGQFSLGHAAFMGIGGYVAGVIIFNYKTIPGMTPPFPMIVESPFWLGVVAVLLGGLIAAIFGLLIGIPTLRLRGDYLAIATLGFGEIVYTVLSRDDHIGKLYYGGSSGLHNIPSFASFFWVYMFVVIGVVATWRIVHSAKGKAFFAVREDEIAAGAMGVDVTFYKVAAFVIGAFFAGITGGLYATYFKSLVPDSFRFDKSIDIVVMVVLGGSGSITGAILAAVVLTGVGELLHFMKLQDYRLIIYALLLIGMMLLRPSGLLGRKELWWVRRAAIGGRRGFEVLTAEKKVS